MSKLWHDIQQIDRKNRPRHLLPLLIVEFPHSRHIRRALWRDKSRKDRSLRKSLSQFNDFVGNTRHPGNMPRCVLGKHSLHINAQVNPVIQVLLPQVHRTGSRTTGRGPPVMPRTRDSDPDERTYSTKNSIFRSISRQTSDTGANPGFRMMSCCFAVTRLSSKCLFGPPSR